jgi:GntR family transcriptional regulator
VGSQNYRGEVFVADISIKLARNSPIPLYHQLARQLEAAIENGEIAKGEFLDNELDLVNIWQISRPTVRRAIQELVEAGLLVRRRGVGTQVVSAKVRRPVRLTSFYQDLIDQGRTPTTQVLLHERRPATKEVAEQLGIATGSEVVYLERVRSAGKLKLALLSNYLLLAAAAEITTAQLEQTGLYENLRQRGVRPHAAEQTMGAKIASAEEAKLLGIGVGAALVTMGRVMHDDTGRVVELGAHVYDAEYYSVIITVMDN